MGNSPGESFGGKKYFWGNVPAYDVASIERNEGRDFGDFKLLFAASGDLRNVVETFASLPEKSSQLVTAHINDRDFDIVARNLIISLVAFTASEDTQAVDCILHLWYSAMILPAHVDILQNQVLPLIQDVNRKIEGKLSNAVIGKSWRFGTGTCRAELSKAQWALLAFYCEVPAKLSADIAKCTRVAITLAPGRLDHLDRHLCAQTPGHRVCISKFREDGILLPFGRSRTPFTIPNPTFFMADEWPMKDSADPPNGWGLSEVLRTASGPATNDLYGKLYLHFRQRLLSFRHRLLTQPCELCFLSVDAREMPLRLAGLTFARVEVSNISDGCYLGMGKTAACLGGLLEVHSKNSHATLISLFMNAVGEAENWTVDMDMQVADTIRALQYFPGPRSLRSRYDPRVILSTAAKDLVRDSDFYFDKYMQAEKFEDIPTFTGLKMKEEHSIIPKWPMRLRKQPGQLGSMEEFRLLQASGHTGSERYVEWKKFA